MAYIGDMASGYEELSSILVRISSVEQLASSRVFRIQFTYSTLSRIRDGEVRVSSKNHLSFSVNNCMLLQTLLSPDRTLVKEGPFVTPRGKRTGNVHLLLFNDLLVEAEEERGQESKRMTIKIWETPKPDTGRPAELVIKRMIPLSDAVETTLLADTRKGKHGLKVSFAASFRLPSSATSTSSAEAASDADESEATEDKEETTILVYAKSSAERV